MDLAPSLMPDSFSVYELWPEQQPIRAGVTRLNMENVLLMTATIAPRENTFLLSRHDPEQRKQDYIESLSFYLSVLERGVVSRIIFAENSPAELSDLQDLVRNRGLSDKVDFIKLGEGPEGQLSRFVLELDLLSKAMSNDVADRNPDDTLFWKITGRYIIRNISEIIRTAPNVDFYANSRDYPTKWTDFYLAAFTKNAFRKIFLDRISDYNTLRSGEEILREFIEENKTAGVNAIKVQERMKYVPRLSGIRGHDSGKYGGLRDSAKYYARVVMNRLVPSLWL